MTTKESPCTELTSLLETLFQEYGYDFRNYSQAHILRRIKARMALSGINSLPEIEARLKADENFTAMLLSDLSITVTEMFRDPFFYKALREQVIPILKTYSFIRIWHAGCATGEEAYSMAILLKEEGLYERTTLYATDFNQYAIERGKDGIYPAELMAAHKVNYERSGGKNDFDSYFTSDGNMVIMDQSLRKNIVWANHNLVTDSVFAEVHLVLCRNVMIYFNRQLQNRVNGTFFESLVHGGFLCLGTKEGLRFSDFADKYTEIDRKCRIFKKKY